MMSGNLVRFPSPRPRYVVDTWPVMEWLKRRQPVAAAFRSLLDRAGRTEIVLMMSIVNLGEVYYGSAKTWLGEEPDALLARMQVLPVDYVSAHDDQVYAAARIKAAYSVSYADAFAASLAIQLRCPLLTGDEDFRPLEAAGMLQLEWLGG